MLLGPAIFADFAFVGLKNHKIGIPINVLAQWGTSWCHQFRACAQKPCVNPRGIMCLLDDVSVMSSRACAFCSGVPVVCKSNNNKNQFINIKQVQMNLATSSTQLSFGSYWFPTNSRCSRCCTVQSVLLFSLFTTRMHFKIAHCFER